MNAITPASRERGGGVSADNPPRSWLYVIILVCGFAALALLWASWAEVDEISRAEGRVIPSGKTQIIQSPDAGVVVEILVRGGQHVTAGQQLVRLDDTTTSSSAGEVEAQVLAIGAQVARLRIESEGNFDAGYICPEDIAAAAPLVCTTQANLLQARLDALDRGKEVLEQRVEQRQRELNEVRLSKASLETSSALVQERLDLIAPLAEKGLVARTEYLAIQTEANDLKGRIEGAEESGKRLEAALSEARLQVQQADLQFRQDALAELTLRSAELARALEQLRGAVDRVARTDIRSPVDGIVSGLDINTIGAVVAAGQRIMDIVPISDTLLVEVRLKPSDVAFIIPGQAARIKLTAYDFSIYGGLAGTVENVAADSVVDPDTRETYYLVLIKADSAVLEYRGKRLPVLPGMVTSVDILTGKKTILHYLLKPINKAREEALSER